MKNYFLSLVVLLSCFNCSFSQTSDEDLIRQCFDDYRNAILTDKGEEAVKCVDSRTLKYYGQILELVKLADSTTVDSLSFIDKFMVFSIRHQTKKEDILSFNGESLFVYAVNSGMVGKSSVAKNTIGEITVKKDFAMANFISNGKATTSFFHFYKENGKWLFDLTALFPMSNVAMKQMLKEREPMTENEFMFLLLEMVSGRKVDANCWKPVTN